MGIRVGGMLGGVTNAASGVASTIGGAVGAVARPGSTGSSFAPVMGMGSPMGALRSMIAAKRKGKAQPTIGAPAAAPAPADKTLKIPTPFSGSPDGRVY